MGKWGNGEMGQWGNERNAASERQVFVLPHCLIAPLRDYFFSALVQFIATVSPL